MNAIFEIINKLWPSQKRRDVKKLERLEKEYAKALSEDRDTDASMIRKQLNDLRRLMGHAET